MASVLQAQLPVFVFLINDARSLSLVSSKTMDLIPKTRLQLSCVSLDAKLADPYSRTSLVLITPNGLRTPLCSLIPGTVSD
jgi:hypothetical protein